MEVEKSKNIYSLLPTSRWRPATSWEGGPQYAELWLWKANTVIVKTMPLLLLSLLSLLLSTSCSVEYPFGQFGSAVLAMSLPKLLPTPWPVAFGGWVGGTALMVFKYCLAVAKTLGCYQHLPSYKCKAQHYEGCYGEC